MYKKLNLSDIRQVVKFKKNKWDSTLKVLLWLNPEVGVNFLINKEVEYVSENYIFNNFWCIFNFQNVLEVESLTHKVL